MEVPRLETQRLVLREHKLSDLPLCAAMWADPLVTKFIGGRPFSKQEAWSKMLRYRGLWALLGFGYWAVEDKASGKFVGELGFADFNRELVPSIEGLPEIGWAIVTSAQGKGYATEGLLAAIAWGDKYLPSSKTVCLIAPENTVSLRVGEKCGYKEILRTTYLESPTLLFERNSNRNA